MRFLIVDANDGPCIRSLFTAVAAQGHEVAFLRPYAATLFLGKLRMELVHLFRWRRGAEVRIQESGSGMRVSPVPSGENPQNATDIPPHPHTLELHQLFLPVPGFTRFPRFSLALIRWAMRSVAGRFGDPDVVVFTMPQYAPLVGRKGQPVVGLPGCQVVGPTPPASSLSDREPQTTQLGTPLPSSLPPLIHPSPLSPSTSDLQPSTIPLSPCHLSPVTCHSPAHVYFAYDAYGLYPGWDREKVREQEEYIAAHADAFFVVSRQLEEDWKGRTKGPLVYLPNATSEEFIEAGKSKWSRPDDLPPVSDATSLVPIADRPGASRFLSCDQQPATNRPALRALVGCIGNVASGSVDWPLVREVAERMPEFGFVFLGNRFDTSSEMEAAMALPNVIWLGARPHEELPAYMQHFDVLWNPMPMTELNHRRCPIRLYDYLTTSRRVISTDVRQAREFGEVVAIVEGADAMTRVLRKFMEERAEKAPGERNGLLRQNSWAARARQCVAHIGSRGTVGLVQPSVTPEQSASRVAGRPGGVAVCGGNE